MTGSGALAQVVERPPRSVSSPGRTAHQVTVQGALLAGYDDNGAPPPQEDVFAPYPSAYTGYGDGTLRYRFGNQLRFFEANGGGYMNTYRAADIGATYGLNQHIR